MQPWSQPLLWKGGATAACDPYFGNDVLLMGFEGANGSTGAPGMMDESPSVHGNATVTASGYTITTAAEKFGSASLNCPGTNGKTVSFGTGSDWQFHSGLFTIEAWINPTTVAAGIYTVAAVWNASGSYSWRLYLNGSMLNWDVSVDGSTILNDLSGGTLTAGSWFHVAVDYDGTKYRLYLNGVMTASSSTARNIFAPSQTLGVGSDGSILTHQFNGYIDELRITKGVGRYANDAGFAVPTTAFPRVQCPLSLTAYRDKTGYTTVTSAGTSLVLPLPASFSVGDLLIAATTIASSSSPVWSTGWTPLGGGAIGYRIATGSDAAPTVSFTSGTAQAGLMFHCATVVAVGNTQANQSPGGTSATCPTTATVANSSRCWGIVLSGSTTTPSTPSGWTLDDTLGISTPVQCTTLLCHSDVAVAGGHSGSITSTVANAIWRAGILEGRTL